MEEKLVGGCDVYVPNISTEVTLGKRPRPTESVTTPFSDEDIEHVTNPHDDALVITT